MASTDVLYAGVLEHMQGGVLAIGKDGRVQAFNPAAEAILGFPANFIMGRLFAELFFNDPANDGFAQAVIDAIYHAEDRHQRDIEYRRDDATIWLNLITSVLWTQPDRGEEPVKAGVVVMFIDITERKVAEEALRLANEELEQRVAARTRDLAEANQNLRLEIAERKRAQEQLAHLADHDALTNLPNRRLFEQRINGLIEAGADFALLYLDLDGFKAVNDGHGHAMGDWLLQGVARRLATCVREGDTLARLGGDEFAVILRSAHGTEGTLKVIRRIIEHISEPYRPDGEAVLKIGVSIGAALYPQAAGGLRDLIQAADTAMYEAKRAGRGTCRMAPLASAAKAAAG